MMPKVELLDPAKFALLLTCLVGGFGLCFTGELTAGVGIVGAVLGYLTGNGRLARSGATPVPTIGHSPSSEQQQLDQLAGRLDAVEQPDP